MEFKKKLKTRLYIAVLYEVLAAALMIYGLILNNNNSFISAYGFALMVMGLVRIRNYLIITKNENNIKNQKIIETDERNIDIMHRAKSAALTIYAFLLGIATIVLSLMNKHSEAQWVAYSLITLIIIYCIMHLIIRKRS